MFLHGCANAIWNFKRPKGLHLYVLVTFIRQKILITLQRLQTSSILNWTTTVGLTTSRLPPLQDTPPITMANLLQAIGFWHRKIQSTYYKLLVFDIEKYNQPTTSYWFLTKRDFNALSKLTWCLVNSPFSFFLSLCTYSQSTMCLLIKLCRVASSNCTPH